MQLSIKEIFKNGCKVKINNYTLGIELEVVYKIKGVFFTQINL